MALGIDRVPLSKSPGDLWTPDDANILPRLSTQYQDAFLVQHDEWGRHRMPAPQAMAIVRWTGSAYVVDAEVGGVTVTRLSAGVVRIAIADITFGAEPWLGGVTAAGASGTPGYAYQVGGLPHPSQADFVLGTTVVSGGGVDPSRADMSFIFEAWGPASLDVTPTPTPPATTRFRLAQDDVLDVELLNELGADADSRISTFAREHRSRGSRAGHHLAAPFPIGARLYGIGSAFEVSSLEGMDPVWSYGLWAPSSRFHLRSFFGASVAAPTAARLVAVRAFAEGTSDDALGAVLVTGAPGGDHAVLLNPLATISKLLVVAYGVIN